MQIHPAFLDASIGPKMLRLSQCQAYLPLALCLVAVSLLWAHKLFWGLWVDEAGTFWMVNDGALGAIRKCSLFPGQSILFGVIESPFVSQGRTREFLLRIPSVFGIAVTAVVLYRMTNRLVGEGAGYLAVLPFLCAPSTIFVATNARPYALAMAAVMGATWALWKWNETGSRTSLATYFVSSVAIVHLQYLFAAIFAAHFIYLMLCGHRRLLADWRWFLLGAAAAALCLLPLQTHLSLLIGESNRLSADYPPVALSDLLSFWFPTSTLYGVCVGFCAMLAVFGSKAFRGVGELNLRRCDIVLLFSWLFLLPGLFWLVTSVSQQSLFVGRYLVFATPAFYVLMAIPLSAVRHNSARLVMLVSILGVACVMGGLRTNFKRGPYELRAPLNEIVRAAGSESVPVFVSSGLHESISMDWKSGPASNSYLFAPLAAYPIPNPILPLPFRMTVEAEQYVDEIIRTRAIAYPRFMLLAGGDPRVSTSMIARFKEAGYSAKDLSVNQLPVFRFDRK